MFKICFSAVTVALVSAASAAADDSPGAPLSEGGVGGQARPHSKKRRTRSWLSSTARKLEGSVILTVSRRWTSAGDRCLTVRPPDDAAANLFSMGIDVLPGPSGSPGRHHADEDAALRYDPRRNGAAARSTATFRLTRWWQCSFARLRTGSSGLERQIGAAR